MARSLNSTVNRVNGRLYPLKNSNNEEVPGFPEILNNLDNLNGMSHLHCFESQTQFKNIRNSNE
jgi:hypothetical protein